MTGIERTPGESGADSSVTLRRSLGRRLKALREATGRGMADMPTVGSRTKIARLEDGRGPYSPPDVRELCRLYGVGVDETEELAALALRTREVRTWDDYTDLAPGSFGTYVDLESRASQISTYQPDAVPGLLQTPEYARAVFRAVRPRRDDVERLVAVRLRRQKDVLSTAARTRICAVLNEAVLARRVGGSRVAADQMRHVRELDGTKQVDVRILTYEAGAHPAMSGSFTLMEFASKQERGVAYVESPIGSRLLDREDQLAVYREVFAELVQLSTPFKEYAP
jgi:hypothetical protein